MKRDKFSNRYLIKLFSSFIIIAANFVIQFILPRAFTVEEYGYYTHDVSVFVSVVGLANLYTSNAAVSKYAKRNDEIGLIKFYIRFFAIIAITLNIGLICIYPLQIFKTSFGRQTLPVVMLALEAEILNKLYTDVISLYDAAAISRFPSLVQILMKLVMSGMILFTYIVGRLNILVFYGFQAFLLAIVILILGKAFIKDYHVRYPVKKTKRTGDYVKEFYYFCRPLVITGVLVQIINIAMDILFLNEAGAASRAMYGAAMQMNALVLYVFSPFVELSKREYAVSAKETEKQKVFVGKSMRTVMWMTSYFAVFIFVFAEYILPIIYGKGYEEAATVTRIIMIFTVFQSWGQLLSTYFESMEQTKINALFSILTEILQIICMILFIMPNWIWPDGLGENGIAIARTVTNALYVMILCSFIAIKLKFSILRVHVIYFNAGLVLGVIGFGVKELIGFVMNGRGLFYVLVCGVIYSMGVGMFLYAVPSVVGTDRAFIKSKIKEVLHKYV